MTVYLYIFIYFLCIALAGTGLALLRRAGVSLPGWVGMAHGLGGLFGVGGFFIVNLQQSDVVELPSAVWWSLAAFSGGLIGGLIFFRVLFRGKAPVWTFLGHGLMAVIGLYLLYPHAVAA